MQGSLAGGGILDDNVTGVLDVVVGQLPTQIGMTCYTELSFFVSGLSAVDFPDVEPVSCVIILEVDNHELVLRGEELFHRLVAVGAVLISVRGIFYADIRRQRQLKDLSLEQLPSAGCPLGLLYFWRLVNPFGVKCHQYILSRIHMVQYQMGEVANFLNMV